MSEARAAPNSYGFLFMFPYPRAKFPKERKESPGKPDYRHGKKEKDKEGTSLTPLDLGSRRKGKVTQVKRKVQVERFQNSNKGLDQMRPIFRNSILSHNRTLLGSSSPSGIAQTQMIIWNIHPTELNFH
ncbi:hypothetical protein U1Q18_018380 [Sarracenia purpurea var. burkii]